MKNNIIESIIVGLITYIVGNVVSNTFLSTTKTIHPAQDAILEEISTKNRLSLFFTGFFINLIVIYSGIRKSYCDKKIISGILNLTKLNSN